MRSDLTFSHFGHTPMLRSVLAPVCLCLSLAGAARSYALSDNLLLSQRASASLGDAGAAIDGDSTTAWLAESAKQAWWAVEMSEPTDIQALSIHWRATRLAPYTIEISPNGTDWQVLLQGSLAELETPVSVHDVSASFRHLRISSSTGLLNGIAEISAYSEQSQVPANIREAAKVTQRSSLHLLSQSSVGKRYKVSLEPHEGLRSLDDLEAPQQWKSTLKNLATTNEPEVVHGLISRIEKTDSGSFRQLGLRALADMYRDSKGSVWEESYSIAKFLEKQYDNPRVDPVPLVSDTIRHQVSISDVDTVVDRCRGSLEVEQLLLAFLDQQRELSPKAVEFLADFAQDKNLPSQLRDQASSLMAQSSGPKTLEMAFENAIETKTDDDWNQVKDNPTWSEHLSWLSEQTQNEDSGSSRQLAWTVLTHQYERADIGAEQRAFIDSIAAKTLAKGGSSYISLTSALRNRPVESFRALLLEGTESSSKSVKSSSWYALEKFPKR